MPEINYLDRGDTRNYVPRRELKLTGNLPKKVEKAALKLVETETARLTAFEAIDAARLAIESAKAERTAAHLEEAKANPTGAVARLAAGEDSPGEAAVKDAKQALKRAEKTHEALREATKGDYLNAVDAIRAERATWTAQARSELEKAVFELAPLIGRLSETAAKIKAASGVFTMYARIDEVDADDFNEWMVPVAIVGSDAAHPVAHAADLDRGIAYLKAATGGASAFVREATSGGKK